MHGSDGRGVGGSENVPLILGTFQASQNPFSFIMNVAGIHYVDDKHRSFFSKSTT